MDACFAAGTKLLVRGEHGELTSKNIEEIRSWETHGEKCDWLLSRDEYNVNGELQWKRAEKRFERLGRIWTLRLDNGAEIRTTGEHPLWVVDAGEWRSVSRLTAGDRLLGHDGRTLAVEGVADEEVFETVFNLRIEEAHTYFVADDWSVWMHHPVES